MLELRSMQNVIVLLLTILNVSRCFVPGNKIIRSTRLKLNESGGLSEGDRILLIGPGFLQLNIAKAAKAAGLVPLIVAPQKRIDTFKRFINDDEIISNADIGLPDEKRTVSGVVFCSEEAVFSADLVKTVLDWEDCYVDKEGPKRVIACLPVSNKKNEVRSMGWMPIFNNDSKERDIWAKFTKAFLDHPVASGPAGTIVRVGSLLGGSIDGIPELQTLGLDEGVYKMSLENYRDMKERAFDRYRLGAQILLGDDINPKPSNQESLENQAIDQAIDREVFRATGGYPEEDRTCRHTAAQAIVQALMRPSRDVDGTFTIVEDKSVPKEFTVLSKCLSSLPTEQEWDLLFQNPSAAKWPTVQDMESFDPSVFQVSDSS